MPENDGSVLLENVRIIFRNFSGRETDYNQAGSRNFAVLLTEELAEGLANDRSKAGDGWNVKRTKPKELDEGEMTGNEPFLPVAVGFANRPPQIWLINQRGTRTKIDEDLVDILDEAVIINADMYIRPYDYELRSGVTGRKAYLKSLYLTIEENKLEEKYGDVPIAGSKYGDVPIAGSKSASHED